MGLCASNSSSAPDQSADKKIQQNIAAEEAETNKVHKLLLLGAGASGKSTLFKQMISIYGKGFPESDRRSYSSIIHNNVLTSIKQLVKNAPKYGEINPALAESKRILEGEMKEDQAITEELAVHIKYLWADPVIQTTFYHQAEFQLTDSAKYFFDKIEEIAQFAWVPSVEDVLRSRAPTTGIVENSFAIDGHSFKMFDVGGQRNERKKWIHCFENVTAVLFVAGISEYNQVLYEDETQNRMVESLTLFDEICNSKWFRNTSMILFLNKKDIFAEKIKEFPLADYFKEYNGPNEYESCVEWIQQQFLLKNQQPQNRQIYVYVTCATDTENVRVIFSAVKDIIIKKNLNRLGLM